MNTKDVPSLENCQRLAKAGGLGIEVEYCYVQFAGGRSEGHVDYEKYLKWEMRKWSESHNFKDSRIPAPSTAQLAEWLPAQIVFIGSLCTLIFYKEIDGKYHCGLINIEREMPHKEIAATLPDALALCACYLLENNLVNP